MVDFIQLHHNSKKRKRFSPILGIILGFILVIIGLFYYFLYVPAHRLYASSMQMYQDVKEVKKAFDEQDLKKLSEEIKTVQTSLDQTKKNFQYFHFLSSLPWFKIYYADGEHMFSAGSHGLVGAQILTEGIKPFADVLGFEQNVGEKELTAEEKLAYIVGIMPQIMSSINGAQVELEVVQSEMSMINPNRYPNRIFGRDIKLQSSLESAQKTLDQVNQMIKDIYPFLEVLPATLGQPDPKTYLIIFQNDKELRPTGGFLTAYALVSFKQGRFTVIQSEDIYNIDKSGTYLPVPDAIKKYLVPGFYMRDTNFSPDFKKSMLDFEVYYDHSKLPAINGIIGLDTEFVRSFLEILGPIYLKQYDETFEAENIVYELELYSEKLLTGSTRKDLLGALMEAMIDRVFNTKKDQWRGLINQGIAEANEKHVLFYFKDTKVQDFVEKFNYAGRIKEYQGDYLHINDANLGGLKSDMYVERDVELKTTIDDDGTIIDKLTITYTNPAKFDGWLNSRTRDYVRVYVPIGSKLIKAEGGEYVPVEVSEDLGKTVFANFTRTYPAGLGQNNSTTITFEYELPFKFNKEEFFGKSEYALLIQKQPGLSGPDYTIDFNGRIQQFKLETDKELQLTP